MALQTEDQARGPAHADGLVRSHLAHPSDATRMRRR